MSRPLWVVLISLVYTAAAAEGEAISWPARTPAPPEARVYIISPKDGRKVTNPFVVRFGLSGMGVAPAGVERPATGHHHLLIDVEEPPEPGKLIPADEHHRHFGGGQTETTLTLTPGQHTLQLLLGDKNHIPHDPVVISEVITIEVVEPAPAPTPAPVEPAKPIENTPAEPRPAPTDAAPPPGAN